MALQRCKYPIWALSNHTYNTTQALNITNNNSNKNHNNIHMVVPYTKSLSKCFKNTCGKIGVTVHFKGGNIIRSLLVAPKDKDNITQKSGVMYRYRYDRLECDEKYTGEPIRTLGERLKEHFRAPSPIYNHTNTSGHHISINNLSTLGRELNNRRTIKGAMYIRVNDPTLKRYIRSFSCPKYGKRSCSTPKTSNLERPFHNSKSSLYTSHTPSW